MRIGILSDSHGRADAVRAAVKQLVESGAQLLLHLGDVGGEAVLEEFIGLDPAVQRVHLVFGNCDDDIASLSRFAEILGLQVDHPLGRLTIDSKSIAFTHGHMDRIVRQALESEPDYLLHGHTHEVRDERLGRTRIINPGALFRASRYTAALLDPSADRLQIIDVTTS